MKVCMCVRAHALPNFDTLPRGNYIHCPELQFSYIRFQYLFNICKMYFEEPKILLLG